eukprot:CAMPEP_0174834824 /NCGR_PEP_ID=MMETSP1114-20130205/5061_1 /TAXON_ID=312471 /ORGANISM="Neobodo designis, Strain CCAP 1951/1" /LENGTH=456 /DNA_ID=CAMNT_0016068753 /DNA_START=126 /DNA_END=1496 /DNA_ORIENTATION=-
MTTVDKVHNVFLSFKGRSPRQVYIDASKELGAKVNSRFAAELSDTVDDFYYMERLDLNGNYFGPKGCLAVLKIVQCQQRLKALDMTGCGLDDIVVNELVEVLQDHPLLRDVVLVDNPDISVFSGKPLARVVKLNVNVIRLDVSGTHVGENVATVLQRACDKNKAAMEAYFSDDWFRMKDMFLGLDVDGSGWVNMKNLVGSVVYPLVQEKLEERIAVMKPKRREDNCIDVTTFMELSYLNFKNKHEITVFSEESRDAAYDVIVGNWASLMKAIEKAGAKCSKIGSLPHREQAFTDAQSAAIATKAVELQVKKTEEDGDPAQDPVDVSAYCLREAIKQVDIPLSPTSPAGKRRQSFLHEVKQKRFAMPPSLVRAVVTFFEGAPPQGLYASKVLGATFETDFEVLKMSLLAKQFKRFSIPQDLTLLTLEEVVNLFDEYYDVIRVPKQLRSADVQKMIDA